MLTPFLIAMVLTSSTVFIGAYFAFREVTAKRTDPVPLEYEVERPKRRAA